MPNVDALSAKNNIEQAQVLLKAAKYEASLHHYEMAATYFEAAQIWEKYLLCHNNRVSIYLFAHQLDTALKEGESVLAICEQVLGEVHQQYVFALNNLAGVFLQKNQYDDALNYYQQSIQISQTLHHATHISVARAYSNIANLFRLKGQTQKALDYYQETLTIQQQLREHHADLANTYTSMGLVCSEMGNYELGLKYHFQSLNIRKETFTPQHLGWLHTPTNRNKNIIINYQFYDQTQNNLSQVEQNDLIRFFNTRTYLNVAQTYLLNKNLDKALAFNLKALGLKLQLYGETHPQTLQALSLLGNIYLQQNNFDKALHCFERYLGICQQLFETENSTTAKAYQYIGNVYYQKHQMTQALAYYQKAIVANLLKTVPNNSTTSQIDTFNPVPPQNTYDVFDLLQSLQQKAKTLEIMGKNVSEQDEEIAKNYFKATLNTYLACDAWIDHIRQTQNAYQDQVSWAASTSLIYENAINFGISYYKKHPNEQVLNQLFYVFEKSKSAALLAGVMSQEALQIADLPPQVLEEENILKANIATHQGNIRYAEWQNDRELLALYQSYLAQGKAEYADFIQKIEQQYPEYYELKFRNLTVNIKTLQTKLPPDTALLNYHVTAQNIYIFQIEKTRCLFHTLDKKYDLKEKIQTLRQSLAVPTGDHSAADMNYLAAYQQEQEQIYTNLASELCELLISPLDLSSANRLLIVPHEVLTYLPFELLLEEKPTHSYQFGNHAYLLRHYAIAYAYSATIWKQMQEKTNPITKQTKPLLAIAPDFSSDRPFQEADDWQNTYFNALNFTELEATTISQQFNGDCLLQEAANKDNFVELAPQYQFLHIASHAKANDTHPNRSYIVFGKQGSEDLDLLYISDIYLLRLNTEMIVLGACETGTGKLQKGEGIASLSRAFAYAGSKSLCTTLWSVNDETNATIIQQFYHFLQEGLSKDIALQQAKLAYIHSMPNDFAHPFFWAAYTLIGDISPVEFTSGSSQLQKNNWWNRLLFWRK